MRQAESKFKDKVRKDLETLDNCWFLKTHEVSIRGIPDFLLCVNGNFVALELKRDEDAPRNKLQDWTLKSIGHAGGMSFLTFPDNWDNTFAVIQELDSEYDRDRDEEWETSH